MSQARALLSAHELSFGARPFVARSRRAGCFFCLAQFRAADIVEFTAVDETPICPRCGVDSVILDATGFQPSSAFLRRMEARWFGLMRPKSRRGTNRG